MRLRTFTAIALFCVTGMQLHSRPISGGLHSTVSQHSSVTAVKRGESFFIAFEIRLEKGWHTYYKNPGDSGVAPTVKFKNPDLLPGALLYPAPERIVTPPLTTFGYHDRVVLLLPVTVAETAKGEAILLEGKLDYLECRESCLPAGGDFSLQVKLADKAQADPMETAFFAAAQQRLPQPLPYTIEAISEHLFRVALPVAPIDAFAIPDPMGSVDVLPPKVMFDKNSLSIEFVAGKPRSGGLLLAVRDKAAWSHFTATLPAAKSSASVLLYFLFALLGGMLLNFMPCVLPVLSLKAVSLASGHAQNSARAYSLGVIAAFSAIGALFLVLRASGEAVGWGFQLQNPVFVAAMALLFSGIAANLFGVFEITFPALRVAPALGDVMTGIVAVAAATPCTAPFMATALGAALTLHPVAGFLLFPLLGVGMSLPFLLLALFPRAANILPRPGLWLTTFKGVLGFMMAGSALWLVWVFGSLTGAAFSLLTAILIFAFCLYIYGKQQSTPAGKLVKIIRLAAIALALAASGWFAFAGFSPAASSAAPQDAWQNFSVAARDKAVAAHKAVFIDFTADWCLSCKVNEKIAFTDQVMALFKEKQVVLLKADFTNRNETIARELAVLNRAGVPVYALYDKSGKLQLLPEILSESLMIEQIQNLTK